MTRAKHRPPPRRLPRLTARVAVGAADVLVLTAALVAAAYDAAPHATAPHTAAAPTAVELTREPTGHGGPIAYPSYPTDVWAPSKGPVIANGQRLPAVTAAPVKTTAAPKPKPAPTTTVTTWPTATPTATTTTPPPAPPPATGLLALVNADRATAGCPPVTIAADLMSQAQTHSNAQAAADFMSHSAGVQGYDSWGENVAAGYDTEAAVESAWMASPGHRANILNCGFTVLGFASAISETGVPYWTQEFAA